MKSNLHPAMACLLPILFLTGCDSVARALTPEPTRGFPSAFVVEPIAPDSAGTLAASGFIVETLTPDGGPAAEAPSAQQSSKSDITDVEPGVTMRVLWQVSSYVRGPNATWDDAQAQAMVFKALDVTETEIIFDGKVCKNVTFSSGNIQAADYLANKWQTTLEMLDMEDVLAQVITTNCGLPGFSEYLRLPDRRLLIQVEGVFFFLEPAVSY